MFPEMIHVETKEDPFTHILACMKSQMSNASEIQHEQYSVQMICVTKDHYLLFIEKKRKARESYGS